MSKAEPKPTPKKKSWVADIRKIHRAKDPLAYAMPQPQPKAKDETPKKK